MKILVCGGRDFSNKEKVFSTLYPYLEEYRADLQIISGMAKGADLIGWLYLYRDWETDRKSTRLNSSHSGESRMPSSA